PSGECEAEFATFWAAYPRKVSKQAALKAWMKLTPDADLVKKIFDALEVHKRQERWAEEGGRYIPHPATWLNERRWEDEVVVQLPASSEEPPRPSIDPSGYEEWKKRRAMKAEQSGGGEA